MQASGSNRGVRLLGWALVMALAAGSIGCATERPTGVVEAVAVPIVDLNIIRAKIPPALLAAHDDPYEVPSDQSCAALDESISDLDHALGPNGNGTNGNGASGNGTDSKRTGTSVSNGKEVDAEGKESLVEKGSSKAGEAAIDALRRTAEGLVPFREWVRKLSGAERHSKLVADAIAAGLIRRAYLKGIQTGKNCT